MPPRAGLTTRSVVAAAAELADRDGLDALTLTAVATKLGVATPSLYSHVDGMEGLRSELRLEGIQQLGSLLSEAAVGRSHGDAISAIAHAMRGFATHRPAMYAATVRASGYDDATLAASDQTVAVVLAVLRGYGLTGSEAIHAARYLRSTVHGFIALEAAEGFGLPYEIDASFDHLVRSVKLSLERWND